MKKMLQNYSLGAAACIVMGIALIIKPGFIGQVLNSIVGTVLIVWAAFGILRFIMSKASDSKTSVSFLSLISNAALLIGGIYILANDRLLERVLMCTLGVYLLFTGLPKLLEALRMRSYTLEWKKPLVSSLMTVIFGALVLIIPMFVIDGVMRIIGIALVIAGVSSFMSGRATSVIKKKHENKTADGKKVIDVKYE